MVFKKVPILQFHIMSEDYVQQCCDKAASFITKRDYDAAEKYLKKALERQPDNMKVLSLLSLVSEGRKKNQNGRELFPVF